MKANEDRTLTARRSRRGLFPKPPIAVYIKLPNEPIFIFTQIAANQPLANKFTPADFLKRTHLTHFPVGLPAAVQNAISINSLFPLSALGLNPAKSNQKNKKTSNVPSHPSATQIPSRSPRQFMPGNTVAFSPKSDWSNRPSSTIVWAGLGHS